MTRNGLFKITAIAASLCTAALAGATQFNADEAATSDIVHVASTFDAQNPADERGYVWSQAEWAEPE